MVPLFILTPFIHFLVSLRFEIKESRSKSFALLYFVSFATPTSAVMIFSSSTDSFLELLMYLFLMIYNLVAATRFSQIQKDAVDVFGPYRRGYLILIILLYAGIRVVLYNLLQSDLTYPLLSFLSFAIMILIILLSDNGDDTIQDQNLQI